ncbi:large-conductance mechanosensitive channel protein MscL [Rufibacter glacialis]|uniref:Large-conductance mechanosensitive channel n=1 Tax=Rufibacter glacialis TaxID=1259555 RepID=A0A5M8QQ50_9BACT|nr:large-conductance mechanosensitive channel protein MscL [Rufibacter glacialis]KAA6437124.1 large-conductance mechanosensitive channel protein MscL [Rufibacter glacialis]GGK61883.1 large-conductance mechanosensitive channel [Rufibacter glacialis]
MSVTKEFKEFAMRGNVVDLAVGIVIGAAFGKIVTSFVEDILMPPLGLLVGGVDFKDLKLMLRQGVMGADGKLTDVTLNYGNFIQSLVDFIIIAIAIFMVVKLMNTLKRKKAASPDIPPAPTKEEVLLTEIRDAIRTKPM